MGTSVVRTLLIIKFIADFLRYNKIQMLNNIKHVIRYMAFAYDT